MDWRETLMLKLLHILKVLHLGGALRLGGPTHRFSDYFNGMEKVQVIREIFGEKTEEILRNLKVEFTWLDGYMWINGANGHLMVSSNYLNHGNRVDVYLDLIHELVHVRQFMEGKELFDVHYSYSERPTEIEAYRVAVQEARRLGLSDKRICEYLTTEWMSNQELQRLAKAVKVNCNS